ncbi:unnamed protein product [Blepharisma stoltei]|uniref:TNFR-Cys domain-containing protein n=1 Tax=Blepharisma stoltei TaxID=1481888 RepID=A0AAU9KQC4_9CILI|nr:unnamed protein product [Blepharisma stoltei]
MPGGVFYFGKSVKGKFVSILLAKSATIDDTFNTITLDDGSNPYDIAVPCTSDVTCIDSVCLNMGSENVCLSSMQYCAVCTATECTTCEPDSARDEDTFCTTCKTTNEIKNGHCNFYIGCAIANNCAECSAKSTQCDVCEAEYFLYDDSATSTSCLSCTDSCTSCEPGPDCYTCATTITQTGTTCRVDSIGYQVSADLPNIVFDFAHPLSTGLSKSSFKATSNSGADIPTTGWTITGCTASLKQCKVNAPNVQESDFPITLDVEFIQA